MLYIQGTFNIVAQRSDPSIPLPEVGVRVVPVPAYSAHTAALGGLYSGISAALVGVSVFHK